jgi:hypothetical protein
MLFMLTPVGYGWGDRGWGPPVPTYIQRRRMQQAAASGSTWFNHAAWGGRGDFVWVFLVTEMFWLFWLVWLLVGRR